jgi:heterodisulfide reductase subunit B
MDRENDYKGTVKVLHFLEFLRDEIGFGVLKKMVKNPLKGMKIMPYYGCMLLRPREVAIDDAEEPTIMGDLLKVLGAEVIDNPFKIECCGSYHTIEEKKLVSNRANKITNFATERGADAIMLSCPLCRFNIDVRGKEAEKMYNNYKQIPVYYYSQLIAVALGLDPKCCGFEDHAVDPVLLLKKKGVFEKKED